MKKSLLLLILLAIKFAPAKAQWVSIDGYFAYVLNLTYPSCINNSQMDTTCVDIINEDTLNLYYPINSGWGLDDISGVQYFKNLKLLDCTANQLVSFPPLPDSLIALKCSNNLFSTLPILPNTLKYLYCGLNQLTSLPQLPDSLKELNCNNNQLTMLPPLPSNLKNLRCDYNQLTSLPTLPDSLNYLFCNNNQLATLPALPNSLNYLYCNNNQLVNLPALPNSLWHLECMHNQLVTLPSLPSYLSWIECGYNLITSLPAMPNVSFHRLMCQHNQLTTLPVFSACCAWSTNSSLDCSYNQITSLPSLPWGVRTFICSNNQLSSLPQLPSPMFYLDCGNNQLTSLPAIPASLYYLYCDTNQITSLPPLPNTMSGFKINSNNITCLSNLPQVNNIYLPNVNISNNPFTCIPNQTNYSFMLPLCVDNDPINNPNNCLAVPNINGNVYKDLDTNCMYNTLDLNIENIPVKLFDTQNNFLALGYSSNGIFNFTIPLLPDTYFVKIDVNNLPFSMDCGLPNSQSVILDSANQTITGIDFPLVCDTAYDLYAQTGVTQGMVFPGQTHILGTNIFHNQNWFNMNCNSINYNGMVSIQVTGPCTYISPAAGALIPQVNGNTFTYNINNFNNLTPASFGLIFMTDTSAQAGNQICAHISILPTPMDADTSNNDYYFCYNVVNSYDPNMKEVYPVNVLPGYNDWFTYTVHFQNTGNAAAINISIIDTLDTNLDFSTFEHLTSSHSSTVQLIGNIAKFRFTNIQLPDSSSNPIGSQGFVQYRIKPLPNLPMGSQIKNNAYIYFDYNSPILTNTTYNNFCLPVNFQQTFSICEGDSLQVGNNWYFNTGTFTDYFANTYGCDSIVTTIINQSIIDTSLSVIGDTIFANANYANYEWIDCANGTTIQNSSSNTFNVMYGGSFKVSVTDNNGCNSMSDCISIIITGNNNATKDSEIKLLPNPANDFTTLIFGSNLTNASAQIICLDGKIIKSFSISNVVNRISLIDISSGIYYLKVYDSNGFLWVKKMSVIK